MNKSTPRQAAAGIQLMPTVSEEQLRILRHMLGIDTCYVPMPRATRDYYCANPGDPDLHGLLSAGLVRLTSTRDGYEWFATTDAGKSAARASQEAQLVPKKKRIYRKWLQLQDVFPDLPFRDFLVDDEFAATRARA